MPNIISSRLWRGFVVAAMFAFVAVGGASAEAPVTIGQTDAAANYYCGPNGEYDLNTDVASGAGYVVPAGEWTITSWSTFAGNFDGSGGSMSMMIFRPAAEPGTYTVLAATPVQALTAGELNTFPASVDVQGGDELGFWATGYAACSTETKLAGDISPYEFAPQPTLGSTVTPVLIDGYRANISATLTPPTPTVEQQLDSLLSAVTAAEPGKSLADKVMHLQKDLAKNKKPAHICKEIDGFIKDVDKQAGGKKPKLTQVQAQSLTDQAEAIKTTLGC